MEDNSAFWWGAALYAACYAASHFALDAIKAHQIYNASYETPTDLDKALTIGFLSLGAKRYRQGLYEWNPGTLDMSEEKVMSILRAGEPCSLGLPEERL